MNKRFRWALIIVAVISAGGLLVSYNSLMPSGNARKLVVTPGFNISTKKTPGFTISTHKVAPEKVPGFSSSSTEEVPGSTGSTEKETIEEADDSNAVMKNIWNVSETFLRTPWYDGMNPPSGQCSGSKFRRFSSAHDASQEMLTISTLPEFDAMALYSTHSCFNGSVYDEERTKQCLCQLRPKTPQSPLPNSLLGPNCDIPESVWQPHSGHLQAFSLRIDRPRRVVMGIIVNHELDAIEVRFRQVADYVDVFVIMESAVTGGGDPKPLYFWNAFRRGFLCEFHSKILYVMSDKFPDGYVQDGWLAEEYTRNYMGQEAFRRINGLNDDDLFISLDADEIPKAEVLLFLKTHDGFNDPIVMNLRWTIFTYYWQHATSGNYMTRIVVGCTVGSFKTNYAGKVSLLRKNNPVSRVPCRHTAAPCEPFQVGVLGQYAGHHCSWCSTPEGISLKLRSAIHQDFPRWGDYPEKLDLNFITGLIQTGTWFDGSTPVVLKTSQQEPDFAPEFMLKHADLYRPLLRPEDPATT